MINFKFNNSEYKIYFQYESKNGNTLRDTTVAILEDKVSKEIIFRSETTCSTEDNFSKEKGRQISLIRLLSNLNVNFSYQPIKLYFKGRKVDLPEKESNILNNLLLKSLINE